MKKRFIISGCSSSCFYGGNYAHPGQELSKNMLYKKAFNYNVSMRALDNPDSPLSKEEIAEAKQRWQRGYIRQNIFGNILKMNFKNALFYVKRPILVGEL